MLELSEDYTVSMSKILTEVTASDSLYCRRFLFSALSLLNPLEIELERDLAACKLWVVKNDAKFQGMSEQDIAHNDLDVTIAAIEHFYEQNPDKLKFEIDYVSFIQLWEKDGAKKENYKKALLKAAESSKSMGFGRTSRLMRDDKIVKVTKSMTVFRSIEVIGLQKIVVKLNPDFMPYLVLLNQVFIGSGYTSFPLSYLTGKNSVSAIVMASFALRIFRAGKGVSQVFEFDIPTLRHLLCCEQKYPVYKDFRKYVLVKGISGINEDKSGGFTMEIVGEKRSGRSVSHIQFKITSESLNSKTQKSEKQKQYLKGTKNQSKAAPPKLKSKAQQSTVPPVNFKSEGALSAQELALTALKKMTNQK